MYITEKALKMYVKNIKYFILFCNIKILQATVAQKSEILHSPMLYSNDLESVL